MELAKNYFDTAWYSAAEPLSQEFNRDKRQFDYLFENMPIGFVYCKCIFDDAGKIIDFKILQVNDAFKRITKMKIENIIGKKASQIIPTLVKNEPEIIGSQNRVAFSMKNEKHELYFKNLGIWLSISIYSPKRGYCVALFEDINERKKDEFKILEEKTRAEQYLNVVNNAILALDIDGKITLLNKKGSKILVYEEEELLGKKWVETCIPEKNRPEIIDLFNKLKNKGRIPKVHENLVLTKDGKTRTLLWNNIELKDRDGQLKGILCSGEDVTEKRKTERTLIKYQKKLVHT